MPTPYEEKISGRKEFTPAIVSVGKHIKTAFERKMAGRKAVKEREKEEREDYQRKYIEYLTELPYDKVKGTGIENDWHDVQASLHGSVRADTRSTIQRTADELYESGPLGATLAAVADILPGLPGIDIIDPPDQLSNRGMQSLRNILGVIGGGAVMSKTPQAIGRVVTNVREPFYYHDNAEKIMFAMGIKGVKDIPGGLWRAAKSIVKDKPLYNIRGNTLLEGYKALSVGNPLASSRIDAAPARATEFLYRKMFGLKPRVGKNIFKVNPDGTYSFNPKSKHGRQLLQEILDSKGGHSVMRQYKRTPLGENVYGRGTLGTAYEDIWDFKLHPNEVKDFMKGALFGDIEQSRKVLALRAVMHPLTKPVHIKGIAHSTKLKKVEKLKKMEMMEKHEDIIRKIKLDRNKLRLSESLEPEDSFSKLVKKMQEWEPLKTDSPWGMDL